MTTTEKHRVTTVAERPRRELMVGRHTVTATEQCGNCRFFRRRTDAAGGMGGGFCVRFPPIFRNEDALNDGWQMVHQQSWCGEWKAVKP